MYCKHHESLYIKNLLQRTHFIPQDCCKRYININDNKFKLKIESFGSGALILGNNKGCYFPLFSKDPIIKCSGLQKRDIKDFFKFCKKDVEILFQNLSALN